jgi:hypothetical protein
MRRMLLPLLLLLVSAGTVAFATLLIASPQAVQMVPFLSTTPPDGYLSASMDTVVFLRWTEDDQHHLQGQLMNANITEDPTRISQKILAFTGIHNGSDITLTFSMLGMQVNAPGTLSGDTLTLEMQGKNGKIETETYQAATIQQFNDAMVTLQKHIKPTK